MNSLILKEKRELSAPEDKAIQERISAPEHVNDKGPPRCWSVYVDGLYAFYERTDESLVGLAEASGRPTVSAGWWVDSRCRGQGYGSRLVDVLADFLKGKGVTDVGELRIQTYKGEYDGRSAALELRFRGHFT